MKLFAIPGQLDVIVTSDAVLNGGRELTGDQIAEVAGMIDRARLETLWREAHQTHALGSWVTTPEVYGTVAGHMRASPGADGHTLRVHTPGGAEHVVPVAQAQPAPPPQGAA